MRFKTKFNLKIDAKALGCDESIVLNEKKSELLNGYYRLVN